MAKKTVEVKIYLLNETVITLEVPSVAVAKETAKGIAVVGYTHTLTKGKAKETTIYPVTSIDKVEYTA